MTRAFRFALRAPIQFYRWFLSPLLPPRCRFVPTCSTYALEAVDRFGGRAGGGLALRRLCRCHPWGGMGYDPVPDTLARNTAAKTAFSFSDSPRF